MIDPLREQGARRVEQCICAAIQLPNGEVWRGHRHDNCIQVAGNAGVSRDDICAAEQGFITSLNRFVGREEGARIQRAAGIVSANTGFPVADMLFSEDLYLRAWREASLPRADAGEGRAELCQKVLRRALVDSCGWCAGDLTTMHYPDCELLAALAAPPVGDQGVRETLRGWQPIETAPKDGRSVLLWWPYWCALRPTIGHWQVNGGWQSNDALEGDCEPPTHWAALLTPPVEGGKDL